MPDDFVGYAAVADEPHRNALVFKHGLVTALDYVCHKLLRAVVSDFVLRLVAHPTALLNVAENTASVHRANNLKIGFDDFHIVVLLSLS